MSAFVRDRPVLYIDFFRLPKSKESKAPLYRIFSAPHEENQDSYVAKTISLIENVDNQRLRREKNLLPASSVSPLSETIAKITLDSETRHIADILFLKRDLRFKCKRCAVFCCKLGGPLLTRKDMERLKHAGYKPNDFLASSSEKETKQREGKKPVLKRKEDGSCVFLEHNGEEAYRCRIYEVRPALCRLYPFEFERTGINSGVLRLIPCCNGLNDRDGSMVDKKFVEENLLEAILDLP